MKRTEGEVGPEAVRQPEELPEGIVDILGSDYLVHWTRTGELPKILARGLYSKTFAKRIGDKKYTQSVFTVNPDDVYGVFLGRSYLKIPMPRGDDWDSRDRIVGIVMHKRVVNRYPIPPAGDVWGAIKFRVAPREFVGLVLVDEPTAVSSNVNPQSKLGIFERIADRIKNRNISKSAVLRRANGLKSLFASPDCKTGTLPIYGSSGDLYYPRQLSHEQIRSAIRELS